MADAAQLSSLSDETPEGRSIVVLAKERYGLRGRDLLERRAQFIPFSATTRMSGADLDGRRVRKGASDGTPLSAILSAIIFNGLIIPLLVPPALRGIRYRPIGATALPRRNVLLYGVGGIIAPFIGIKLVDLLVHNLLGA